MAVGVAVGVLVGVRVGVDVAGAGVDDKRGIPSGQDANAFQFDYAIRRYQVVQEERGRISFRVVKGGRFSDEILAEVLATFREHLGRDMRIDVEFVEDVAMVRIGKIMGSVSRLGIDFQTGGLSPVKGAAPAQGAGSKAAE